MSAVPGELDAGETSDDALGIAAYIRQRDAQAPEYRRIREAERVLGGIVPRLLPDRSDLLTAPEALDAWRALFELGSDSFLSYMQEVHRLCGRRVAEFVQRQIGPISQSADRWPDPVDLAALSTRDPLDPEFILGDWMPAGYASLVAGHGGLGKSAIMLHLAICIALGSPFAGIPTLRRRVMYLSCEDRAGVLHWRLARICAHLNLSLRDLAGWLDLFDLVGHDSVLWVTNPRTGDGRTRAYAELENRFRACCGQVLFVDGISDAYGGSEISRAEVKRFINSLVALIPPDDGAVLLIGHVAKPSTNGGDTEGYSGSTAWHNSARARWYIYPEMRKGDDGNRERTGRLLMELQKSNLGRIDQTVAWRWDDEGRMFLPEAPPGNVDRRVRAEEELHGIRLAIQSCADAGISVPAALQGPRTAHLVLSQRPEFPESLRLKGRNTSTRFRTHIEKLRQLRHITTDSIRRANRHTVETIVLTAEGGAACAQFCFTNPAQ